MSEGGQSAEEMEKNSMSMEEQGKLSVVKSKGIFQERKTDQFFRMEDTRVCLYAKDKM